MWLAVWVLSGAQAHDPSSAVRYLQLERALCEAETVLIVARGPLPADGVVVKGGEAEVPGLFGSGSALVWGHDAQWSWVPLDDTDACQVLRGMAFDPFLLALRHCLGAQVEGRLERLTMTSRRSQRR